MININRIEGNFRQASTELRETYLERTRKVQETVRHLLDTSSRESWKCDPNRWSVGQYEEVTRLLQGYVDNEVNLNPSNDCKKSCSDYKQTKHYTCFNDTYCSKEDVKEEMAVCKGTVVDCQFIGSDMNICASVSLLIFFLFYFRII